MNDSYIYICHSWSYTADYNKLVALLNDRGYFSFKNYSVEKDDPLKISSKTNSEYEEKLKEKIKEQMRPCQVVLVIAGKYVTYSDSIQLEIDAATELNKPIIAIRPFGAGQVSSVAENAADKLVSWNADSIVEAIRELK